MSVMRVGIVVLIVVIAPVACVYGSVNKVNRAIILQDAHRAAQWANDCERFGQLPASQRKKIVHLLEQAVRLTGATKGVVEHFKNALATVRECDAALLAETTAAGSERVCNDDTGTIIPCDPVLPKKGAAIIQEPSIVIEDLEVPKDTKQDAELVPPTRVQQPVPINDKELDVPLQLSTSQPELCVRQTVTAAHVCMGRIDPGDIDALEKRIMFKEAAQNIQASLENTIKSSSGFKLRWSSGVHALWEALGFPSEAFFSDYFLVVVANTLKLKKNILPTAGDVKTFLTTTDRGKVILEVITFTCALMQWLKTVPVQQEIELGNGRIRISSAQKQEIIELMQHYLWDTFFYDSSKYAKNDKHSLSKTNTNVLVASGKIKKVGAKGKKSRELVVTKGDQLEPSLKKLYDQRDTFPNVLFDPSKTFDDALFYTPFSAASMPANDARERAQEAHLNSLEALFEGKAGGVSVESLKPPANIGFADDNSENLKMRKKDALNMLYRYLMRVSDNKNKQSVKKQVRFNDAGNTFST